MRSVTSGNGRQFLQLSGCRWKLFHRKRAGSKKKMSKTQPSDLICLNEPWRKMTWLYLPSLISFITLRNARLTVISFSWNFPRNEGKIYWRILISSLPIDSHWTAWHFIFWVDEGGRKRWPANQIGSVVRAICWQPLQSRHFVTERSTGSNRLQKTFDRALKELSKKCA